MADRIKLLPDVVANQIAAGEVVNRPASVIKEMMENAIDAGASSVTVNFRDGGRDLIQIVDNGCGMSPIDARMAFDRHATSKISSVDDIYAIHTFGFRGEALASIAAVAQVELRTRQAGDDMGTLTTIHGGKFVSQEPVMCPAGSQFMVRNLFYNVPARRKFMENPNSSAANIRSEFRRVALCNPDIRFELYANDAPVYSLAPASLAGRIVDVIGRSIKQNLLEVDADTSIVSLRGFVGRPAAAKVKNAEQYMFVNGRYFKSSYFASAVVKAYDKLIPEGTAPAFFIYMEVKPDRIDVNVHPQKTEVKFADEQAVWSILNAAVRESLAKTGAVPMMDFNEDDAAVDIPVMQQGGMYNEPRATSNADYNPFSEDYFGVGSFAADSGVAVQRPSAAAQTVRASAPRFDAMAGFDIVHSGEFDAVPSESFDTVTSEMFDGESEFEFIQSESVEQGTLVEVAAPVTFDRVASIGGGYAAALYGGRFVAVDLRRVRERLLFDSYMQILSDGTAVSQQLLFPEHLTLSTEDYALIEEHAVDFASLGFDIEYSGGGEIDVKGTPADMPADSIDSLVYELLRALDTPQTAADIRRERVASVMARSGARTLRKNISHDEAASMLDRLAAGGNVSFTPSGKQIMAEITADDIKSKLN